MYFLNFLDLLRLFLGFKRIWVAVTGGFSALPAAFGSSTNESRLATQYGCKNNYMSCRRHGNGYGKLLSLP